MLEDAKKTAAATALAGVLIKSAGMDKNAQGFWESVQPYWEALQPYLPYAAVGGLGSLLLGDERSSLLSRLLGGVALGGLGGYGIENWLMPWIQQQYGQPKEQQTSARTSKPTQVPRPAPAQLPRPDTSIGAMRTAPAPVETAMRGKKRVSPRRETAEPPMPTIPPGPAMATRRTPQVPPQGFGPARAPRPGISRPSMPHYWNQVPRKW